MLEWIKSLFGRARPDRSAAAWARAQEQLELLSGHCDPGLHRHVALTLAGMRAVGFPPPRVAAGPSQGVYAEWLGDSGLAVVTWYDAKGAVRASAFGYPKGGDK